MNELIISPSVLTVFVLLTCLACIYMVFFFGRRLQTSAYLRDSLIEGAKQQELKILLRELHDRAIEGPLDPKSPPPEKYGPTARLWEWNKYKATDVLEEFRPLHTLSTLSPKERADEEKREEKRRQELQIVRQWEADERVRYEALRQQAEFQALERAEKKIPRSIDISLLGGGWAFLLEFSTVIVIIFTLLIFGILGTLEGKDIATILAAIAGYVLGKATATTRQEKPVGEAARTSAA